MEYDHQSIRKGTMAAIASDFINMRHLVKEMPRGLHLCAALQLIPLTRYNPLVTDCASCLTEDRSPTPNAEA